MSEERNDHFVPIILAAGAGRRMGGPKALLDIGGMTAIERCLGACSRAAERCAVGVPIVVYAHGADEVLPVLEATSPCPRPVLNPAPEQGQTGSVRLGIEALPESATGFLIFPVDHSIVDDEDVEAVVRAATADPDAPVVLPSHGGRAGHPALVRVALREEILALGPDDPLRDVLRAHRDRTVFVNRPGPRVTMDLDTPDDLATARRYLLHEASRTERESDERSTTPKST